MSDAPSTGRDRIVPLDLVPQPSGDEPEPFIVGNEHQLAVAYRMGESDMAGYGASFDDEAPFCVLLFPQPVSHAHTNEDFSVHPLASRGLVANRVHEVVNSTSVVAPSTDEAFARPERHFVIAFRDSTFECIAADCVVAGIYGSGEVAAREAFMLCQ